MRVRPVLSATVLAISCAVSLPAAGVTGTWNVDAAGNWTTAASWTGGIPNGAGDTANLTSNITANRAISLAGNKTVGTLNIGDPTSSYSAYSISSGTPAVSQLIFDQTGTADAMLTVPVVGGVAANAINSLVVLKDNLVITAGFPDSGTTQLAFSGMISDSGGNFGITKEGAGIIQLAGPNSYKGGTTVNGGRVNANNLTAFGSGGTTVASGAQVFVNTASLRSNFTIAGTGYTNSADVAAQAGAIRIENNRMVIGDVTVASGGARLGVHATAFGFIDGDLAGSGNLEINGPTTTTGNVTLLGSGSGYTGTLSLSRGNFNFAGALGGSMIVMPAAGATTTLNAGTSIAGALVLDSTNAPVTFRNARGPLAIGASLSLEGNTPVRPTVFPAPGTGTLTLMTYPSMSGGGTLTFDATNYRGTPAISVGATSASITGLDGQTRTWTNASTDGLWNINSSPNWAEGEAKFFNADAVVFTDAGAGTVTLAGTLTPHSVTFSNSGADYVISGTGGIDGAGGGIIKDGAARVTLGGANTFTGPVSVNAGSLILGSKQGLGFTSGMTIASGGSFDINGQDMITDSRAVDVTVGGTGDGVSPAICNNGADVTFSGNAKSGIRNVTLTADTTVGGLKVFDIGGNGVIEGNGHTLTKVGMNQVWLLGVAKNLNTVVEAGTLSGFGPDPFGTTLRIKAGGIAQAGNPGVYSSDVTIESGGILQHSIGSESLWTGSFTATGNVELTNGNTTSTSLTIVQDFLVPANLIKNGIGVVTLHGDVSVLGTASVNGGILLLGNGGTTGSLGSAPVSLTGGGTLSINRSDSFTLPNDLSGTGNFSNTGPGTTTISPTSTFSGSINITAGGVSLLNPAHSGGLLTIGAGTKFEGGGGFGNTTANGILSPGPSYAPIGTVHITGTGTAAAVNLNISATGTYLAQINTDDTTADKIEVTGSGTSTGNVSLAGALAVSNLGAAVPVPGTKFTLLTYTGTLTGTFASLPEGAGLAIGGKNYIIRYADGGKNVTLTAATAYDEWILGYYEGSTGGETLGVVADPDKDGVSNMIEYVLGSSPANGTQSGLPTGARSGGDFTFTFTRRKEAGDIGFLSEVEYSFTLAAGEWITASSGMVAIQDNGSTETVTVTIPVGIEERIFARLRVTAP